MALAPVPRVRPARRARRRSGRPRTVLAVAIVVALLVAACADDDGGAATTTTEPPAVTLSDRTPVTATDLGPFDLDTDGMAGPATPLGAGLEVPEGAVLLGLPFPDLVGAGFRALMLVPGDPVAVFNAVADQAGGLGMDAEGGCLGEGEQVACAGRYVDAADGERLRVTVERSIGPAGVVSGLALEYDPPGSDDGADPDEVLATPPGVVASPPLPAGPIEEPNPADVAATVRAEDSPRRTLEAGSALVGLPGPCACDGSGWSFVVELTGVERDVLSAYARQFSDVDTPPDLSDTIGDTYAILGVRVGTGRPVAEVRAVVPDSGPAYAIVSYIAE